MGVDKKLIDEMLKGHSTVEEIAGENGLLKQLTKAIVERALQAELTTHLGYERHSPEGHGSGNSRNGASSKRLKGEFGTLEIAVTRDRQGRCDTLARLRRPDPVAVRARHDDARDPGPPGGDLSGGGVADADL